ncbi:MAG: dihydrolipoyl dehydrogenase family protein [Deinococcota bacterium]
MEQVDALVIGAGMAGVPLALRLGFKGLKTVLVERAEVGGTCLNRGCIPTKTMIASARVAHLARSAAHYGVRTGPVQVDLKEVVARKDALVTSVRASSERNLLENPNVELLRGEARFVGERRVVVGDREISAERVFINTGARNRTPALQGLEEVAWLDSTSALYLSELPRSLLIVGGGYVSCEFAQMYARFGTRVTLVQRHSQLLPQEDADVVAELHRVFQAEDIELVLKAEAERVRSEGGQVVLSVRQEGKERELRAERLMLAAGREPNTKELNLVAAGVKTNGAGFIRVDEHLETGAPGV